VAAMRRRLGMTHHGQADRYIRQLELFSASSRTGRLSQ
jgi:hypothetical protein